MKYKGMYFTMISMFLKKSMLEKFGKTKTKEGLKKGKKLYRDMIESTEDIGAKNPMAGNIYAGFVFLAICKAGNFDVDDFMDVTTNFMHRKFIQKMLGRLDMNSQKDRKKMLSKLYQCAQWAENHPEYKEKTWDFHFDETLHQDGIYYYFTRCPMEKFARENNCLDLLPICCNLDYLTLGANKGRLYRAQTLASGGEICDYWIVGDKAKDLEEKPKLIE